MTGDEKLREDRMVFYAEDIERFNAEIDNFLELSKARCVLLVDRDGHMVTRRGESVGDHEETISALIAGSFAATKEMARLLGENEFALLFHQGTRDSIQLQLVGERSLMATWFDGRTNLGMVRFYAQESGERMEAILQDIADSGERGTGLGDDYGSDAEDALNNLF